MDPFAEFIHPDAPWDEALAQLLGDGSGWPSTTEPFAEPGLDFPPAGDLFAGYHDAMGMSGGAFGYEEYQRQGHASDGSPSAGSVGTHGGTATSATETTYTMSPVRDHDVRVKGEGSTEGEVGWGVVGEGWGVAPGLLGILDPALLAPKMPMQYVPDVVVPPVASIPSPAAPAPAPSAKLHNKARPPPTQWSYN